MLIKNLQHHSKLSNKPMKLNSAKYKMRAPRVFYLFNKFRLDFWQLLQQNSWYFGFSPWYMLLKNLQHHSKLSNKPMKLNSAKYKMRAPRISYLSNKFKTLGARILYLAEFNFNGLFDNLRWCWRFPWNIYQGENPNISSCIDAAGVRNRI